MRRLYAQLPADRRQYGTSQLEERAAAGPADLGAAAYQITRILAGPFPCRGKADNQDAIAHGNPTRDPRQPWGDHPAGTYRVTEIRRDHAPASSYGPFVVELEPVSGDALARKHAGATGLALHGGDPAPDGGLRPTDGCNRVYNEAARALVAAGLAAGDEYVCEDVPAPAPRGGPT